MIEIKNTEPQEQNLLSLIKFRFLPYWPLLILTTAICFAGGYAYMKLSIPTWEAEATLLIKDEKKGSDDSRMMDALNVFNSKKIVENEIEVIKSRALMKEVAKNLGLYAPVIMKREVRFTSAYIFSPVRIMAKDPENIAKVEKVSFSYDSTNTLVKIGSAAYPIDTWVKTPYGELMFVKNKRQSKHTDLPLFFSLYPIKHVVVELSKKLNVGAPNKLSSIVNLQFADEVPERAEDILNELISTYNRAELNDKNALADNTLHFIEDRLNHVKFELDSVDKEIQQYRSKQGAINLSEQGTLFLRNVGENDQRAAVLNMQLAVLNQVQAYVNSGKSKANIVPSTLGIEDPVLSQLLNRLSNAEIEYEKLKHTTAENNPLLISLANEIAEIRPSILESIRIQKLNLKTRLSQLQQTNQKYTNVLQTIPEKERKLLEISRQKTIINDVYDFLLQKKEETAISYASTLPDSRILDVAESTIRPVSPKKTIAFGAALFLALIIAIGLVIVKDFSSNKILFRSEIEQLSPLPVLGEVGLAKKEKRPDKKFNPQSYYQIIATLGLYSKTNTIKKLLLTSSTSGDGKSFVCANLAKAIAETGKRVVVVDLDFKKQSISNYFSTDTTSQKGVVDFLSSSCAAHDTISSTAYPNISLVRAGSTTQNYTALITNNNIDHLIAYLESHFDFIIIDTSPIDPVADALILSQLSDATLYIVKHGHTPKALFKLQNEKVKSQSPGNVGIIFNGIKSRGFLKGPGYGYGKEYKIHS